jgi:deoxyribodipyrimidine photo-lyase
MRTTLVWFRQDLRLGDQPALRAALQEAHHLIPVYIHAPEEAGDWAPGAASRWWLHHSLAALDASLRQRGSRLIIRRGSSAGVLLELAERQVAPDIYTNRLVEPALRARDRAVQERLAAAGVRLHAANGALLTKPWELLTQAKKPYTVFTPFWRAAAQRPVEPPLPAPRRLPPVPDSVASEPLESLGLLPRIPWDSGFYAHWTPGEGGALARLRAFREQALKTYASARDRPDQPGTSRLSPHLHCGDISPRQIHAALSSDPLTQGPAAQDFLRELYWREFAHHVLYHFPHTATQPLSARFAGFAWREDAALLKAWQRGRTGLPIVDAGLRELWHTGFMHNRVRMIAASLLIKHGGLHWLQGARWFWDTLLDADLAQNSLNWQWCAGCGADAAPYFRIFNPVLQGRKFDPDGAYVKHWVPELRQLPPAQVHEPWTLPLALQQSLGFVPGRDYPLPVLDLKAGREAALARYRTAGTVEPENLS